MKICCETPESTEELGTTLAGHLSEGLKLFFHGDLGAGKTTLVRGIMRGLGYGGKVKSPTYTLVEPYEFKQMFVFHFDFYRVRDRLELEAMGIRDYLNIDSLCLIEWPENADGVLGGADIDIFITIQGDKREVVMDPCSELGNAIISKLNQSVKEQSRL